MTGPGMSPHYGEELQDLLDGVLAEPKRSAVESHVRSCPRCARELEALRWVMSEAGRHAPRVTAPAELRDRVRSALDLSDRAVRKPTIWRRAWIAGALAAAAVLLVFVARTRRPAVEPAMLAADFLALDAGTGRLDIRSSDPATIEAYFARNGIDFETRVFDLGMMQYELTGGRIHQLAGRPSALFAYRGPDETLLVCQMYEGRVSDLPASTDVRERDGIEFHVHRSGSLTMVFWQEGDVVCVLTSDAPLETVVQLAFAKAERVET